MFGANAGHKPAPTSDNYPFDLDASERFTRLATGRDYWPSHSNKDNYQKLGLVSGFMREQDAMVWGMAYGRDPYGPIMSALPVNLQWQMTVPGLTKQLPTNG